MIINPTTNMTLTDNQIKILCTTCRDSLLTNPITSQGLKFLQCNDNEIGFEQSFTSTISYIFRRVIPYNVSKYLLESCLNRGSCIPGFDNLGKNIITSLYNYSGIKYGSTFSNDSNDPLYMFMDLTTSESNTSYINKIQKQRLDYCFASTLVQFLPYILISIIGFIFGIYIIIKLARISLDTFIVIMTIPPLSFILPKLRLTNSSSLSSQSSLIANPLLSTKQNNNNSTKSDKKPSNKNKQNKKQITNRKALSNGNKKTD